MVYDHDTLKFPDEYFPPFPSELELNNKTNKFSPKPLIEPDDYSLPHSSSSLKIYHSLANSYCLSFIRYIPEDNLKPYWFRV